MNPISAVLLLAGDPAVTAGQSDGKLLLTLAAATAALLAVNVLFYKVRKTLKENTPTALNNKPVNTKAYAH
jgi:hypothetical protein